MNPAEALVMAMCALSDKRAAHVRLRSTASRQVVTECDAAIRALIALYPDHGAESRAYLARLFLHTPHEFAVRRQIA